MMPFVAAADKSVMLIFCRMNCHKDLLVYDRYKLFYIFFCIICVHNKQKRLVILHLVSLLLHYLILFSFLFVFLLTKIHVLVKYFLGFINFFYSGHLTFCLIFI